MLAEGLENVRVFCCPIRTSALTQCRRVLMSKHTEPTLKPAKTKSSIRRLKTSKKLHNRIELGNVFSFLILDPMLAQSGAAAGGAGCPSAQITHQTSDSPIFSTRPGGPPACSSANTSPSPSSAPGTIAVTAAGLAGRKTQCCVMATLCRASRKCG